MDTFVMQRIRSALRGTLLTYPIAPEPMAPLTLMIESGTGTHLVSKLYRSCSSLRPVTDVKIHTAWEQDLGRPITDY